MAKSSLDRWRSEYLRVLADVNAIGEVLDALGVPTPALPRSLRDVDGVDPLLAWRMAWLLGKYGTPPERHLAVHDRGAFAGMVPREIHLDVRADVGAYQRRLEQMVGDRITDLGENHRRALQVVWLLNQMLTELPVEPIPADVMDLYERTRSDYAEVFEAANAEGSQ